MTKHDRPFGRRDFMRASAATVASVAAAGSLPAARAAERDTVIQHAARAEAELRP